MTPHQQYPLMYNHFSFMAPTPTSQDDYYAQIQSTQKSGSDDKKPLKLKLKTIVKKPSDPGEMIEDIEKIQTRDTMELSIEHAPKSRLVEREHAGE